MKKYRIGLICSAGGHFYQTYELKKWWQKFERFWVTQDSPDTKYLLKNEKVYQGYFPVHRNILNAVRNFILALQILKREKPDILFSTGAGICPPFFLAGKLFGCKLIFLESYSFVRFPSLTAKIVRNMVDEIFFQHKSLTKIVSNSKYIGSII